MTPVSISKPEHSIEDGWHVASSSIAINGKTYQIKYRASEGPVATGSEPFLAAALLPAMKVEQALQVPGTVSPKLHAAIDSIQDIYHAWFPGIPEDSGPRRGQKVRSSGSGYGCWCLFQWRSGFLLYTVKTPG